MTRDMTTHAANLSRVSDRIAEVVVEFCAERIETGRAEFHMDELREAVRLRVGPVAPDSPGRILRDLRWTGRVEYQVVSRKDSRYRVDAVHELGAEKGAA